MELIYSTKRSLTASKVIVQNNSQICILSSRNTIAFTSETKIDDTQRASSSNDSNTASSPHYVYVIDIDRPWQPHFVLESTCKVVSMDWHISGYQLFIISENGMCQVYEMQNYLLNNWKVKHQVSIAGEAVITAKWISQGTKLNFLAEKRENYLYTEKLVKNYHTPVLSFFGNRETQGIFGVTTSGSVFIALIQNDEKEMKLIFENLEPCCRRLTVADVIYQKNGEIAVVTSTGCIKDPVQLYRVRVQPPMDGSVGYCVIIVELEGGFHLQQEYNGLASGLSTPTSTLVPLLPVKATTDTVIYDTKFMPNENGACLVVASGSKTSSQVQLWRLTQVTHPVHRLFQNSAPTATEQKCVVQQWQCQGNVQHSSQPLGLAMPQFPIVYSPQEPNRLFQYIAVGYLDGAIKIVSKYGFQSMTTTNLDIGTTDDIEVGGKRGRPVPCVVSMQQSHTGCVLVGLDQLGSLYVMKVLNTRDPVSQVPNSFMVGLLQYCTWLHIDHWDLLVTLKPGQAEAVVQKYMEDFVRQPTYIQEAFFRRYLIVLATLYWTGGGRATNGQAAGDYRCRQMLTAISTYCYSLFGPTNTSGQIDPLQRLKMTCANSLETDLTKVLYTFNMDRNHDYAVDVGILQMTQPLLQWAADLVLYLVTILPASNGSPVPHGMSLLRDATFLCTLRELLLLSRLWMVYYCNNCTPRFTSTQNNLDVISEMYSLLTRIWLVVRERAGPGGVAQGRLDWDESLLEKSCLLHSQVHVSYRVDVLFNNGSTLRRSQGAIFAPNQPISYEFGKDPNHIPPHLAFNTIDNQSVPKSCVTDSVYLIGLGMRPSEFLKECSRCGAITLLNSLGSIYPTIKGWDQRWIKSCLCGGLWTYRDKSTYAAYKEEKRNQIVKE